MNRNKIIILLGVFVFTLSCAFVCFFFAPIFVHAQGKPALIAVLLSRDAAPYRRALDGFRDSVAGNDVEISVYDLDGSPEEGHRAMSDIREKKALLILAIGSVAASSAVNEERYCPVVFTMVSNPSDEGFMQRQKLPASNFAGVCLDVPAEDQFKFILSIFPSAKRIGVIYDRSQTGMTISEAAEAAKGLGLELVAVPVNSEAKVPDAIAYLRRRVDALWAVADGTVFGSKSTKYIITYTLNYKIPFFGLSSYFVKEGALASLHADYYDLGSQAGDIAKEVLSGTSAAKIPIASPRKTSSTINLRTALSLGIKLPQSMIDSMGEVIR